jgi:HD-GYP domain-containing protein (c-di-GMP phosphodiesterase class II)
MTQGGPISSSYPASATVRDRCRAVGVPTWRCDTGGAIVEEPTEPGLAGLWLRSGHIGGMVSAAARVCIGQESPAIGNPAPGCWLLPVVEDLRRRRTGVLMGMALSPEVLTSDAFGAACRSAGLDETSARQTIRKIARFDEHSARAMAQSLQWMAKDLVSLAEHQNAVQGFTTELSQSYETIDLLYSLGRSMYDLEHPDKFITQVCERLHETLPFSWLAARFLPERRPGVGPGLTSRMLVRGQPPGSVEQLEAAVHRLAKTMTPEMRGYVVPGDEPVWAGQDARVLAQPIVREGKVVGVLVCGDKCGDDPQISSYDQQLLEAAAAYSAAFLENTCLYQDQQAMFLGSLKALTAAIDAKDRYTCGHSERVAMLSRRIALSGGLSEAQAERVHICGLLHDVGKIGVPEAVLCKPGKLTEEEFGLIKLHPEIGYRILKDIPMLEDVLPGVLHHHERWDGRGYPHRIAGQQIPLVARIIALADTFDAMSSTRSYRPAMPRPTVLAEIARAAGTQLDPDLASRFSQVDLSEYDALVARHAREHAGQIAA